MKHLVFAIASALAVVAWAGTTEVGEAVQVDVVKITPTNQNTIVAVRTESLADGAAVSVHDYVKTSLLDVGTFLYVFDKGKYLGYILSVDEDSGSKVWEPLKTASTLGTISLTPGASDFSLNVGTAFWIVQNSQPDKDGYYQPIVIYGAPVNPPSAPQALPQGRTLVANLASGTVNDLAKRITNASVNDAIVTADGKRYSYGKKGKWGYVGSEGVVYGLPSIAIGEGFWYIANGETTTITWTNIDPSGSDS